MQNEWSDDDLEDGLDDVVVPIDSMVPKPQVLSSGQNLGGSTYAGGSESRASAYNERMERARNAVQNQRKSSTSGACTPLAAAPPPRCRTPPAAATAAAPAGPARSSTAAARARAVPPRALRRRARARAVHALTYPSALAPAPAQA